jgi:hypothetical protein
MFGILDQGRPKWLETQRRLVADWLAEPLPPPFLKPSSTSRYEEARDVLSRALTQVRVHSSCPEGWEAAKVIGELQRGRFSHYR